MKLILNMINKYINYKGCWKKRLRKIKIWKIGLMLLRCLGWSVLGIVLCFWEIELSIDAFDFCIDFLSCF